MKTVYVKKMALEDRPTVTAISPVWDHYKTYELKVPARQSIKSLGIALATLTGGYVRIQVAGPYQLPQVFTPKN